jgi:hypothetical protein
MPKGDFLEESKRIFQPALAFRLRLEGFLLLEVSHGR